MGACGRVMNRRRVRITHRARTKLANGAASDLPSLNFGLQPPLHSVVHPLHPLFALVVCSPRPNPMKTTPYPFLNGLQQRKQPRHALRPRSVNIVQKFMTTVLRPTQFLCHLPCLQGSLHLGHRAASLQPAAVGPRRRYHRLLRVLLRSQPLPIA